MKAFKNIDLSIHKGIATLKFNRPDQLNAMNGLMMNEIIEALKMIIGDDSLHLAVITGEGRAFMAGADIKEYGAQTDQEFIDFQNRGTLLYDLIENAPIPFIAAINGFALGGGFEIALACDMIVAAESAKIGLPEIHLGLIPGGGGTQRLLQKIGMNRVKEILMLGQSLTSDQLYNWGVVNLIIPDHLFNEKVTEFAEKICRRPSQSLNTIKQLLKPEFLEQPFERRITKEKEALYTLFHSPVAQGLIQSFGKK